MTQNYKSLGRLCAEFQRPISEIKRAMDAAGVLPEFLQDGVPFFSELAVERMADRLPERNTIQARAKR